MPDGANLTAPADLRRIGAHPDHWYPLAWSHEVKPGKALGTHFAGDPIMLARSKAGEVFALTPGQSTALSGLHHAGVLVGMAVVAVVSFLAGEFRQGAMRLWTVGGCAGSAAAILGLVAASAVGPAWPLRESIVALGVANGAFAVAAIGSMMGLASAGQGSREGVRMGLWGAAQALAFGGGGLLGTGASDLARLVLGSPSAAYAAVFMGQAVLFLVAARLAAGVFGAGAARAAHAAHAAHVTTSLAPEGAGFMQAEGNRG